MAEVMSTDTIHTEQPAKAERSVAWYLAIRSVDHGVGTCAICGLEYKRTGGRSSICEPCRPAYKKQWAEKNREKIRSSKIEKYEANKQAASQKAKIWYASNKDKVVAKSAARRMQQMLDDPELLRKYDRDRVKAKRDSDPSSSRKYRREYVALKRRTDPAYKLNDLMSAAVNRGLVSGKAGKSWKEMVEFTVDELRNHLEGLFLAGMSWDNHGKGSDCWHIDHKIPLSAHNFTSPDHFDFKRAWSLSNLQPMWEVDNLRKQDKLTSPFQPSLALPCG